MKKRNKEQNLLLGAIVLLISNILVKVIGAIFRIPMYNMLGDGMAYFNAAYNFYVTIYLVSTAGIPVAISRMVASARAEGKHREGVRILRVALALFTAVGFVAMAIMIIFAKSYAEKIEIPESYLSMYAIAPTLFFICISSTFRGYYQGKKNMTLSAYAQVIEALLKLVVGMLAVWYFMPKLKLYETAAYAISGVTIGVVFSLVFALVYHFRERQYDPMPLNEYPLRSRRSILKELSLICLPIAVSSCITGLTSFVDNNLIVTGLMRAGVENGTAISLFGAYTSIVVPLFNMPPTLIYPFAISLLPNLAAAYTSGDEKLAKSVIDSSLRVASLIAMPCAFGMACVPEGIIRSLYKEAFIDGTEILNYQVCASALSIVSISIFFLAMISITNSILQAWHKEYMPIISSLCGIIVKWIVESILLGISGVGINGAAISTFSCHFTILLLNMIFTYKYTGYFPKVSRIFAKPFAASALCGAGALISYRVLLQIVEKTDLSGAWCARFSLVGAVGVAVVVYFAALSLMKGFEKEDILMLPKGEKIYGILRKIKAVK